MSNLKSTVLIGLDRLLIPYLSPSRHGQAVGHTERRYSELKASVS
jgi:hypothetical protein